MNIFFILLLIALIYLLFKNINLKKSRNKKLNRFKKNLLSKESNIKKIFLRDDERTSSNPDINIFIGLFENEIDINRKSNIHRSRLAKFKKSKLNGEIIYSDKEDKLFKYIQGKKIYLDD